MSQYTNRKYFDVARFDFSKFHRDIKENVPATAIIMGAAVGTLLITDPEEVNPIVLEMLQKYIQP